MTMSDRQDWAVDQELASKYEVIQSLGAGGMGRVLHARHRQLKRDVAIKLLQHDLKAEESVKRFLREARAAAQIRSPHVAHVMDAGVLLSGQPYIVMEYLEGEDLSQWLARRGRVDVAQAADFILQALLAIAEAHSLGIIHRDIKPGNLFAARMAGDDHLIKVLDFGLAKTSQSFGTLDSSVTERGAMLGTPSYMAPEQFMDAQDVDVRADIWALGASLFALVTGVAPFTGKNLPQIYTAVMHRPIPSVRDTVGELPEALDAVIRTCLSREREQRYADVAELAIALQSFAPPAARERVERIRRVLKGERRTLAGRAGGDKASLDQPLDDDLVSIATDRGSVSSTFPRASRDSLTARASRWLWHALLLAVLVAGTVTAAIYAKRGQTSHQGPPTPRPSVVTSPVDTTQASIITPVLQGDLQAPDIEQPDLQASPPTPVENPQPSVVAPLTVKARLQTADKRPRKNGPARASKRSLYERYP